MLDHIRWTIAWFILPRWARKMVAKAVIEMSERRNEGAN